MNFDEYMNMDKKKSKMAKNEGRLVKVLLNIYGQRGMSLMIEIASSANPDTIIDKGVASYRENYPEFEIICPEPHVLLLQGGRRADSWKGGSFTLNAYQKILGKEYRRLPLFLSSKSRNEDSKAMLTTILQQNEFSKSDDWMDVIQNDAKKPTSLQLLSTLYSGRATQTYNAPSSISTDEGLGCSSATSQLLTATHLNATYNVPSSIPTNKDLGCSSATSQLPTVNADFYAPSGISKYEGLGRRNATSQLPSTTHVNDRQELEKQLEKARRDLIIKEALAKVQGMKDQIEQLKHETTARANELNYATETAECQLKIFMVELDLAYLRD